MARALAGDPQYAAKIGAVGVLLESYENKSVDCITGVVDDLMNSFKNVNNETGSITLETIITLNWKHIFTGKSYEGNMESVATTIKDAIESPTNYYFSNQPSIKNRTFLREINV